MTKEKSAPENSQNLLSSESNHEATVQGFKRKKIVECQIVKN